MKKVFLDTDTDNEIDDQYALAYLIKSKRAKIVGISAVPYFIPQRVKTPEEGMEKSFNELLKIIRFCGEEEALRQICYKGSRAFLPNENEYIESDACNALIREALKHSKEDPLYVVAIGALTNIASALIKEPKIKDKVRLVILGGTALHLQGKGINEFNINGDVPAAQVVFKNVEHLTMIPALGVCSTLLTTEGELRYWLSGKNDLCDYLVENTVRAANSYAKGKPWSRVIWDVSAICYLFDIKDSMYVEKKPRFIPVTGSSYKEYSGKDINYVYLINRDIVFDDLFRILSK